MHGLQGRNSDLHTVLLFSEQLNSLVTKGKCGANSFAFETIYSFLTCICNVSAVGHLVQDFGMVSVLCVYCREL